ncbi:MAG: hypothetical protein V2A34_09160 [Lentisphaerota bacterium]
MIGQARSLISGGSYFPQEDLGAGGIEEGRDGLKIILELLLNILEAFVHEWYLKALEN